MRPDFMAALGRGGDRTMAHMTPGEAVIPTGTMTPKLWAAYQEALDRQGMTPEQYVVGSGENSVNPMTGQPEFLAQTAAPGRSVRDYQERVGSSNPTGRDPRESGVTASPTSTRGADLSGFYPEINPEMGGSPARASQQGMIEHVPMDRWGSRGDEFGALNEVDVGGVGGAMLGLAAGGIPGAIGGYRLGQGRLTMDTFTPYDAYGPVTSSRRTSLGRDTEDDSFRLDGATQATTATTAGGFTRPSALLPPGFLDLSSMMSPLQMRSAIASRAVGGDAGEYRSPEAQAFYDNLLRRSLIGDDNQLRGMGTLLPIDLQYLAQVRGIENPADTAALLGAL